MKLIELIKYRRGPRVLSYRPIDTVSTEWEAIARHLKVRRATIANARCRHTKSDAASEVLNYWLRADTKATWIKLIEAIKVREELTSDAEELKTALLNMVSEEYTAKKYIKKEH